MNRIFKNKLIAFRAIYLIVLIGFVLSQWPFLPADADIDISSGSRGSWTDEGLSTCQIRNYINHGHFDIMGSDNFLKTPLLSFFLYPFFKLFGISLVNARVATVLFCSALLLVFLIGRITLFIGSSFVLTAMMFPPMHQYGHLCLAEMYSSVLIVTAAVLYTYYRTEKKYASLTLFYVILIISVLFKIQFAYVLALPILVNIIAFVFDRSAENRDQIIKAFIGLGFIIVGGVFIFYMPLKEEWKQVADQQSGSISLKSLTVELIWINVKEVFILNNLFVLTGFFILTFFAAVYLVVKKQFSKEYLKLLMVSLSWFLLELHKLGMSYLPLRYVIGLYMSMGFFIAIIVGYYLSESNLVRRNMALLCLLAMLLYNGYNYKQVYSSRSYTVQKMNDYFKETAHAEDIVIGAWAPGFTWESKCISYPIWIKFLGKKDIINYYHPTFIVAEDDQDDSGYAYKIHNIDLNVIADLILQEKVVIWNLEVYKVK